MIPKDKKMFKIVECVDDEKNIYITLEICKNIFEAENKLLYYLNHDYDAYLEY
jgi:hypothetical protein